MRLVAVESPFAGDVERHVRYLRACLRDCFLRGEYPIASHGLYTQPGVLDDDMPDERRLGITAGLAWAAKADATILYVDMGISPGMHEGAYRAEVEGRPVEIRRLGGEWAGVAMVLSEEARAS